MKGNACTTRIGMIRKAGPRVLAGLLSLFVFSCSTSLSDIRDNPGDYIGERLVVSGEVTQSVAIPFTDTSVCILSDGDASIIVLSQRRVAVGDRLRVDGELVGFDGESFGDDVSESVESLSDALVEREILGREGARVLAETTIRIARGFGGVAEQIYVLVEDPPNE